jgi:hypothetical protein
MMLHEQKGSKITLFPPRAHATLMIIIEIVGDSRCSGTIIHEIKLNKGHETLYSLSQRYGSERCFYMIMYAAPLPFKGRNHT